MIEQSDAQILIEMARNIETTIASMDKQEVKLETQKLRADALADDKVKLQAELDAEFTRRRWQLISKGQCPINTRILVRGKDNYPEFATRSVGGTWLSNRMLLDYTPTQWMLVPD